MWRQHHRTGTGRCPTGRPDREPADFAPNDIFAGTSHALVTRCQGADGWTMVAFDNTGPSFAPAGTGMVTIIHPNGFISFVPGHELAETNGGRIFSFITPEVGGYRPDNTGFTSYPAFPDLTTIQPPIVVIDPFHGTNPPGVYPLQLDFSGSSTDTTNCGAQSWSGLFDLYAWPGTNGNLDGALYQFASGQRSFGTMTVDGSLLTLDATGSGDRYTETFHSPRTGRHLSLSAKRFRVPLRRHHHQRLRRCVDRPDRADDRGRAPAIG